MANSKSKAETSEVSAPPAPGTLPAPQVQVAGQPKFSLTVFFYAVLGEKRFPAQQTVSGDTPDEFTEMLTDFWTAFVPEEGDLVTYEPREVGGPGARSGGSAPRAAGAAASSAPRVEGPLCPFHGTPTTQKKGPNGAYFFSCSKKREDGSWCNWRPPTQGGN